MELLTLGVLWQVYAGHALDLATIPGRVLAHLVRARQRGGRLKPAIDLWRGTLGRFLLSSTGRRRMETPLPTLEHLDRLLAWLSANDSFGQVVLLCDAGPHSDWVVLEAHR